MKAIILCLLVAGLTSAAPNASARFAKLVSELMRSHVKSGTPATSKFRGSPAFKMLPRKPGGVGFESGGPLTIIDSVRFHNGTIELDVAGSPAQGADESARGFIGIAFRVQSKARFEIIYLRPTNSLADDQFRRNHTTQYSSEPDWPWDRLRAEAPGVYESWADIRPGNWTHMRINVHGTNAALYVNRAPNPCLIVRDLKLGDTEGSVGLWMGQDTDGYFRDLRINPE